MEIGGEKRRERGRIGEESGKKEGISRPRNGGKNERKKDDESEGSEMKGEEGVTAMRMAKKRWRKVSGVTCVEVK